MSYYEYKIVKTFDVCCIEEFNYGTYNTFNFFHNIFQSSDKIIKINTKIKASLIRYETNNIDKAVSYSYILEDGYMLNEKLFFKYFITWHEYRKRKIKVLINENI